jgi:hypothetical protein
MYCNIFSFSGITYGAGMKKLFGTLALSASMVVFATTAFANGGGVLAQSAAPAVVPATGGATLAFPSVFGVASAVPAPSGSGFAALSYVNPRGGVSGSDGDGDLSLGYTIGNPIDAISATAAINVLGLDPFGDSGNVSLNFSRLLRAGGNSATFLGLGVGDLLGWGDAEGEDAVYTLTVSHLVGIATASGREIPLQVSVGFGNETTLSDDGRGTIGEGAYLGLGIGLTESLAASLSATETQLNLGFSLTVPSVPGLGLSVGMFDVTDNTSRQQLSLGASFAF